MGDCIPRATILVILPECIQCKPIFDLGLHNSSLRSRRCSLKIICVDEEGGNALYFRILLQSEIDTFCLFVCLLGNFFSILENPTVF